MEEVEFLVVGAGPAGSTAAREAASAGIETLVLEKDRVVGAKRVCAAGLRPGFCETFDLPRDVVHCDTPRLALFDAQGREHEVLFGPGHTSTREELDGTMARLAQAAGAEIRTQSLLKHFHRERDRVVVEYADITNGTRRTVRARSVFVATGATARFDRLSEERAFDDPRWDAGLMTTLQYRVYLDRPAAAIAYQTLELHYYVSRGARQIVAWMFPKRDHLAIGLGLLGKLPGAELRKELDAFTERVGRRLYPAAAVTHVKEEGHLLFGGWPRAEVAESGVMVGGTAAGLVDATNGEGIFEAAMSGRFAAHAILEHRDSPQASGNRYRERLNARFRRRLEHRVRLMRFLEERPKRYALLFEELASSTRFSNALYREDRERTPFDRLVLYAHALRFGLRASFV
ncbi:MAG: NAD(P)/FAD-dependent oxidoreductase [Candidatus Eremiobacteraeota bacterium]|nr:NAD(P)/FAD-dependent oxidoreductase [Candidatus Eremiobacteraeota bacterium]